MGKFFEKLKRYQILLLLFSLTAVVFALMIPAAGAEANYQMVAGYSANLDTSMIEKVDVAPSSTEGHYDIDIYITQDYAQVMNSGSVYNYYSLSEFIPSLGANGKYGSFYASEDVNKAQEYGGGVRCFSFTEQKYIGKNGIFAFQLIIKAANGGSNVLGPFTYTVDPSLLEVATSSYPFDMGGTDTPAAGNIDTTSSIPQIAALKTHLLVDAYSFGGNQITAGQEFDLSFTLKNFSKTKDAKNIVVKVTPGDGASLKSDTNLFYYESIPAGKTLTQTVRCKLSLESATEIQSITIDTDFQYYDKKDEDPITGGDSIILSIPTSKINRAKITAITIPKDFKQDKEANIEYGFINNGFAKIYNAEVFIYDEEGTEVYWDFIGTLEAGTKATTNKVPLKFTSGGDKTMRLVVQYEDENLAVKSMEKTFIIPVKSTETTSGTDTEIYQNYPDGMNNDLSSGDMMIAETPSSSPNIFMIIAIVVILALIVFLIIRRILKNRKSNYDDFYQAFPKEGQNTSSNLTENQEDTSKAELPYKGEEKEENPSVHGEDPS